MKEIFLLLISIMLVSQQSNATAELSPQKENSSQPKDFFNISSWSAEVAAMQTNITSVRPSPDGKYVLIESYPLCGR